VFFNLDMSLSVSIFALIAFDSYLAGSRPWLLKASDKAVY
jgi:hypothetical protein